MDYHLIKSDKVHIPNATYIYHGQSCISQPFNSEEEDFQRILSYMGSTSILVK